MKNSATLCDKDHEAQATHRLTLEVGTNLAWTFLSSELKDPRLIGYKASTVESFLKLSSAAAQAESVNWALPGGRGREVGYSISPSLAFS